jgi:hypothetical protein
VRVLLASPKANEKFSGVIMLNSPIGAQHALTFTRCLTISETASLTRAILDRQDVLIQTTRYSLLVFARRLPLL